MSHSSLTAPCKPSGVSLRGDTGALNLTEYWVDHLNEEVLPASAASLPVEAIPFMPSPESLSIPVLATSGDFLAQPLPHAFQSNPAKLDELAKFNGQLLLARLRLSLDRGDDAEEWRRRIRINISLATIRQVFTSLPKTLVEATPGSTLAQRVEGVAAWLINEAQRRDWDDVVKPLILRLHPSSPSTPHTSVRDYLFSTTLTPVLPDPTPIITDFLTTRTSTASPLAQQAAAHRLRTALGEVKKMMGELGEDAKALCWGSWKGEEMQLIMMAIKEFGGEGEGGRMTEEEVRGTFGEEQ